MKATQLLIAAAVFAGLASLSFAGPGPDYWARINAAEKNAKAASLRTKAPETKAVPAPVISSACTNCQGCQAKKS